METPFEDHLYAEMTRIYDLFCSRRIIFHPDKRVEFEDVWDNSDAKLYYDNLAQLLSMNIHLRQKREYPFWVPDNA